MLTPDDIRDIISILDSTILDEFHVETASLSISLRRDGSGREWTAESTVTRAPHVLETDPLSDPPRGHAPESTDSHVPTRPVQGPADNAHLHPITPPILGTFYRSTKPGSPPYVEVGSTVAPDTVVGMIETMKMMSPVLTGVSGTISEICIANAEFVDTSTTLMLVEIPS